MNSLYTTLLSISLVLLACAGCESDPAKDSDRPGGSVPINPVRPDPDPVEVPLGLEAELEGRYIDGIAITGGSWESVGSRQSVRLTFKATGLVGIGQFDMILKPEPSVAFDMGLSQFVPEPPFVTLGTGVERLADGTIRFIGVDFTRGTHGDAVLGTLKLRTESTFSTDTQVKLTVSFFSVGPTSSDRDEYSAEQLNVGVVVNGEE